MNFQNQIFNLYEMYESWKERDQTNVQIFSTGPIHQTNYFLRDNVDYDLGGRVGNCGYKKDHRRVYLCPNCYEKVKNQILIDCPLS